MDAIKDAPRDGTQVIPKGALAAEARMYEGLSVVKIGSLNAGEAACLKKVAHSVMDITSTDLKMDITRECEKSRDKPICNADFYSAWLEPPDEYPNLLQTIHELQQSGVIKSTSQMVLKWDVSVHQSSWESLKPFAQSAEELLETKFQVTLFNSPTDTLGFKVKALESSLAIQAVMNHKGLAAAWNQKNTALEIRKKHCIVEVNGLRGTGKDLQEAMKAQGMLQMTIVRPSKMMSCEDREVLNGQRRSFVVAKFATYNMSHFR